jgi:aspartate kinase
MSHSSIVAKFGGTSMADLSAMRRSAKISIEHNANLVVVSAVSSVTNLLVDIGEAVLSTEWENVEASLEKIKAKHLSILEEMNASAHLHSTVTDLLSQIETLAKGMFLLKECSPKAFDSLLSLGERISSKIFAETFLTMTEKKVKWLDARDFITTDSVFNKATPNIERIKRNCQAINIDDDTIYITQGFIGCTTEGETTTLGRGGSDYSAALFAEGLAAEILQIWTDVAGIATTDPRIVANAQLLNEITYSEAAELATFGAKILHPTTLSPALRSNIKVFVGSSYEPQMPGTWIVTETQTAPLVRAMATRKDQALLTLSTPKMADTYGFLFKIFEVFNRYKISIDSVTTSEISVAVTVNKSDLKNREMLTELETLCQVKVEDELALVSLIGNNINHTPNLAAQIFSTLEDINVRMICLGASKHNFCFLVEQGQAENCIKKLHREFIK